VEIGEGRAQRTREIAMKERAEAAEGRAREFGEVLAMILADMAPLPVPSEEENVGGGWLAGLRGAVGGVLGCVRGAWAWVAALPGRVMDALRSLGRARGGSDPATLVVGGDFVDVAVYVADVEGGGDDALVDMEEGRAVEEAVADGAAHKGMFVIAVPMEMPPAIA
jgi:hypothetical protein